MPVTAVSAHSWLGTATHKNKQVLRAEVSSSLGQSYSVAKQPGDSSKEPLHGRFPRLCEGIH